LWRQLLFDFVTHEAATTRVA